MSALTEPEVFVLADRALEAVVAQVTDEQWAWVMPERFAVWGLDHPPTLRELLNRHAYDDAWVPNMLAGRTMSEVGLETFSGDVLGDNPKLAFRTIVDKAVAAAESLDDLSRTVHCSFGDFTAQEFLWQANAFRGFRAWDIGQVTGAKVELSDALVEGLWAEIGPVAEPWRTMGIFPAAVPVPDDAPQLARLLGLVGLDPTGA